MAVLLPLKEMTRLEKLQAMEALWTDLTQDENQFDPPAWHEDALREAERAVRAGEAEFGDWNESKERLRLKAARMA